MIELKFDIVKISTGSKWIENYLLSSLLVDKGLKLQTEISQKVLLSQITPM